MPEGPELCMNSRFINAVCRGRVFGGKILKSAVSKCADVDYASEAYVISSESRGKELALTLQCSLDPGNRLRLLFRFGMSGKFRFTTLDQVPKHAHLQFFARCDSPNPAVHVLSFVDVRRFGSWHVIPEGGWGENRGPDPMFDYSSFRRNVLENLEDSAFNRPLCEALLNQKYFNGIGNYLRAEILYRAGVPPFVCARKVLESLPEKDSSEDLLSLCHTVPQEVINLKQALGKSETMVITEDDYRAFSQWLQCYENPEMNTARDHNGRTIWFKGEAGPMCPKLAQGQRRQRKRKRQHAPVNEVYKTDFNKSERAEDDKDKAEHSLLELSASVKRESPVEPPQSSSEENLSGAQQAAEMSRAQPAAKRVRRSVSGGKVATHKDRARKRAVKRSTPVQPTRRSTRLKMKKESV